MNAPLSDEHRAYLTAHAITDEVISAAEIFSDGGLIVFPWRDRGQETFQTRPWPGPPGDYRWQSKPLHLAAWRPMADAGSPVVLVEGTKQALAVASWAPPEYAVYGMCGCRGWANEDLSRFEGCDVFVMLDADAARNLDVYTAGVALGDALDIAGARPRFIRTPGSAKEGIDDYLAGVDPEHRSKHITRLTERAQAKPAERRPRPKNGATATAEANVAGQGATGLHTTPSLNSNVAGVAAVAPTPWDGAALLDEALWAITAYVAFADPVHAIAAVLYVAVTHAVRGLQVAPRLRVKSPVKQCGKSRLLRVLMCLVHKPLPTANVSPAALVRSIGPDPSTLVLDEMDAMLKRDATGEMAEALRGILNAGFERGWTYDRYNAATGQVERFPTFALAILAGIGDLPDTIEDRSVIIPMARKTTGTKVARFRIRRDPAALLDLGARLAAWIEPLADVIGAAEPAMPPGMSDRAEDTWEPLIAVADAAGGPWPGLARHAAQVMASEAATADADASRTARLLADIRTVFGDEDKMHTTTILAKLATLDGAPWGSWSNGRPPLDAISLADILRQFRIRPREVRLGEKVTKGYYRGEFIDAWQRYASQGEPATPATPATPQFNHDAACSPVAGQGATTAPVAAAPPGPDPYVGPRPPGPARSDPMALTPKQREIKDRLGMGSA